ncbi:MAG: hypothetical protein ACR2LZ_12595, partial [Pyrinomonadaceae bacterium]
MFKPFSRTATSLMLVMSLWTTAVAVAAPQTPQASTPAPAEKKESGKKNDNKDSKDKKSSAAPNQKSAPGGTLSSNEDPRLIGKRNINKGIIIPKMAGSLEKEVA